MGMYVVLTIFLFQKGSSESKAPDRTERVDVIPENSLLSEDAPAPVKRGDLRLKLYQKFSKHRFIHAVFYFLCPARFWRRKRIQ